ncbi:MAG: hypothetical protein WD078_06805 [Woeseia sp.]
MTRVELEALANKINDAVVQISYRWQIFCQLYDSGPESIDAMNRRGSNVFQLLQTLIIDDIVLSLARLTDKASVGRNVNASLPYLLDQASRYLDQNDHTILEASLADLTREVVRIRNHRNKALAHVDLRSALHADRLPRLTYDELESAMAKCKQFMSDLTAVLFGWSTHYDVLIPYGCDGATLLKVLKAGNRSLDAVP